MGQFVTLFQSLDYERLLRLLLSAAVTMLCLSIHELCHGLAAWKLGDPTAKRMGRLSLNPLKHLDPLGAIMLLTVGVGWAKPVSVDPRYFKEPKRGMALTALAGPASNLLLTLLALLGCSLLWKLPEWNWGLLAWTFFFLSHLAVRSLGLALFNLIPISPLDGSKVLLAVLPEKLYWTILRYERYIFLLVIALTFFGAFDGFLTSGIQWVLNLFCRMMGVPFESVVYGSYFLNVLG